MTYFTDGNYLIAKRELRIFLKYFVIYCAGGGRISNTDLTELSSDPFDVPIDLLGKEEVNKLLKKYKREK